MNCRISGEPLIPLFTLGDLFVSDFVHETTDACPRADITLALAPGSGLVQLETSVDPDLLYRRKYWYRSGGNQTMFDQLRDIARKAQALSNLEPGDLVVDIGCNDCTLLNQFDQKLHRVGFDPAVRSLLDPDDIVLQNYEGEHPFFKNYRVIDDYFSLDSYKKHLGNKKARVVTAIAMFYDLNNPKRFLQDISEIMHKDGLLIIQMSYLPMMLETFAFDNICHEHVGYYSLSCMAKLLDDVGFIVVDVELNDVNGGSFRLYVRKTLADPHKFGNVALRKAGDMRVYSLLSLEDEMKLNEPDIYNAWFIKIIEQKLHTTRVLADLKQRGKTIYGYGARTKGNTILQFYKLGPDTITAIAERNPEKVGLKTVGSNIPIISEEAMREASPDYLFILPWAFLDEFKSREKTFLRRGGQFVLPIQA